MILFYFLVRSSFLAYTHTQTQTHTRTATVSFYTTKHNDGPADADDMW